jgi:TRAP-type C4-dicarboxylate transport system substrate-binding protein
MEPTRLLGVFMLVGALLGAGEACSSKAPENKAAVDQGPVSLRLGTADESDTPGGEAITEFVRLVRTASGGKLLIYPVWQASGADVREWDQGVARMVKNEELPLGMIPARTWDTEGVTSLRALNAPFLVTSDALADKIVGTKDLAGEMMAGLDKAGVSGLALLPEGLRHPFGFGHALATQKDYAGKGVRAPRSDLGDATIRALGGKPQDMVGDEYAAGARDGTLAGAETGFVLSLGLPAPSVAVANLTFNTKVNTLVINSKVLNGLSAANRTILQNAATATRSWVVSHRTTEASNAAAFCNNGGKIVDATAAELRAAAQAVQPIYTELEKDAATKAQIDRIHLLKQSVKVPAEDTATVCP